MNDLSPTSAFNPQAFMDATFQDANSIVSTPLPVAEYIATAGEPKIRQWTSKDGTKSGLSLDIPWVIEGNPIVKDVTGRDKYTVQQSLMLDLTPQGNLDFGKGMNVRLGKLREATGLNVAGQPFSFRMFQGRTAKIKVTQDPQGDQIYNRVDAVTKVA